MTGGGGPPRLPAFASAAGRSPPRAATGGRHAACAARRCGHPPKLPPRVPAAPRRGGRSAAPTAAGGWPRRRGAVRVGMATPPASGGGGSDGDGGGDGDGLPWLQRLQAKAAATFEELDDGQQSYVQALYVAFVVSAFVSASATMVRLYKAWGLPPFG